VSPAGSAFHAPEQVDERRGKETREAVQTVGQVRDEQAPKVIQSAREQLRGIGRRLKKLRTKASERGEVLQGEWRPIMNKRETPFRQGWMPSPEPRVRIVRRRRWTEPP
jgi:hypothetical protein